MQVITGTKTFQIQEPTVVTIGKFDGRHKGHQKLLRGMLARKAEGLKTAVFTFDMAPMGVVSGRPMTVITTNQERRKKMESIGIDYLVEYPFDQEVSHMSPEEFVSEILVGQMNAHMVMAGPDCSFGYRGAGNVDLLRRMGKTHGFQVNIVEKERDEQRDISSTYVREELDRGNMEKAAELLGEPYTIGGTVVHGNHIGGEILGFPTANLLPPPQKHLPPFGVYVSRVLVDDTLWGGVTNIGRKPTINGASPVGVETYIMGLEEDLYGREIQVQLLNFERPEQKFASLEELKNRIDQDKRYAAAYLKERGIPQQEKVEDFWS